MTDQKESFTPIPRTPIDEILKEFDKQSIPTVQIPLEQIRAYLKDRFPRFNTDGLDNDTALEMAQRVAQIEDLSQKVIKLARTSKIRETHTLARKIKLIADPDISEIETSVSDILQSTSGDVNLAAGFLRLDKRTGKSWINFIVRTWGKKPSDFR